jgi:hypothetical protein
MAWHEEPDHPFAGIAEKLKRSEQNIINLKAEIDGFIQSGKFPIIPHANAEEWSEAKTYHRDKPIPLRFSVLAGEVVHHLRSCLDHIIWHFADASGRATPIEFPIFKAEPTKQKEIDRYKGKVKGITNANVLSLIEEMQPYKVGANLGNHALLIIHDMDRFDKHRELVIVRSSVEVDFSAATDEIRRKAALFSQHKLPESEHLALGRALKDYKATPGIAFREFGEWTFYPVITGLSNLLLWVDEAVAAFAAEI